VNDALDNLIGMIREQGRHVDFRLGALDVSTYTMPMRVELDDRYLEGTATAELVQAGGHRAAVMAWIRKLDPSLPFAVCPIDAP
jgi:hypothetical protein